MLFCVFHLLYRTRVDLTHLRKNWCFTLLMFAVFISCTVEQSMLYCAEFTRVNEK